MHKSQGFGSTGSRGSEKEYLEFLKGDFPKNNNLFEGIDTSWSRIEGGAPIGVILYQVEKDFNFKNPSESIPQLLKAYELIKKLPEGFWKERKLIAITQLISDCAGLYLEAVANEQTTTPKGSIKVTTEAINRSSVSMKLHSITSTIIQFPSQLVATTLKQNKKETMESVESTFTATRFTAPYWLNEKGSLGMYKVSDKSLIGLPEEETQFPVSFNLTIEGIQISIVKNIIYKFNDPVKGEVYRPFQVLPDATSSIPEKVLIFATSAAKQIPVKIRAGRDSISGTLSLQHPKGWVISPPQHIFSLERQGENKLLFLM
jgi:hypothetical protein